MSDQRHDKQSIQNLVVAIIANVLNIPEDAVDLEWMFGDVAQWDSLKHVAIITQVEERFGLVFDVDQITDLESVEDIIDLVETCQGQ
ncbi:MAG: acyl carrier protein [Magnetococcales bacterium]|nr:acyl carrier protein [Magnetococcales bacterium]MBF0151943.1 acyl carrier protein [Magnetococcales bacterium]MBF0174847.1 acyl carrier protein [Magnetococcales bacterium]MBF0348917.1 acyl carrier protein [Magnetococcales bacterium]MBF0632859.1 acyl carrier protein [Magnetococcales bacterium]